jgi:hypothetical protein
MVAFPTEGRAQLLHSYSFTDGARDEVGSADGVLKTPGASVANGMLTLDGVNGWLEFSTGIVPTSGNLTVALFVRPRVRQNGFIEFISQGVSGGPGFYIGYDPQGNVRVTDRVQNTGLAMPFSGAFVHLALVLDRSQGDWGLFVDGSLAWSTRGSVPSFSGGSPTRLGRQFDPFAEFFNGDIDDLKIFGNALSAAEVSDLAKSRTVSTVPEPATLALLGVCVPLALLFSRRRKVSNNAPVLDGIAASRLFADRRFFARGMQIIATLMAAVLLAGTVATTASAQPLNTGVWTQIGAANIENATNRNVGGMFNGNCNLSSVCSYGIDANGDYWNAFNPAAGAKILFTTRDRLYWAEALYSTVNSMVSAHNGNFSPNIQWTNAGRNGVDLGSNIVGNVLMRFNGEDPWITLQGPHTGTDILWGELNYNNTGGGAHNYDLMFDHGGLDVFISTPSTTVPEPDSIALLAVGFLGVGVMYRRKRAMVAAEC